MSKDYIALFPGQGSQSLGMLGEGAFADGSDQKIIKECFDIASDILDEDLWDIVCNDQDKLNQTVYTQPIMLCADIAIWNVWLKYTDKKPVACAGHSLGEYAALVCAESIKFSDAILLVRKRAELMQAAVAGRETQMAAIIGLDANKIREICKDIQEKSGCVSVANYNSALQTVIAGEKNAVMDACAKCKDAGAKLAKPLAVSVPSHCSLLEGAANEFSDFLSNFQVDTPKMPVYFNVNAQNKSMQKDIINAMVSQIYSPVNWVQTIESINNEFDNVKFLEFGPGKVLTGLNKRIISDGDFSAINSSESMQSVL